MLSRFVDLDFAAELIGPEWTAEKVIEKIIEGELTAYASIPCWPSDGSADDDSPDDEKYEIARITKIRREPGRQSPEITEWFTIHFEPIDIAVDENEGGDAERVFGYLKSRSRDVESVPKGDICLLRSDVQRFFPGCKGTEKPAAQILAEARHKTADRELFVDKIMKEIESKRKNAPEGHRVINHLRFIKEANVPETLAKSVSTKVRQIIKSFYNDCYLPLSRAPKKGVTEPYFLPG